MAIIPHSYPNSESNKEYSYPRKLPKRFTKDLYQLINYLFTDPNVSTEIIKNFFISNPRILNFKDKKGDSALTLAIKVKSAKAIQALWELKPKIFPCYPIITRLETQRMKPPKRPSAKYLSNMHEVLITLFSSQNLNSDTIRSFFEKNSFLFSYKSPDDPSCTFTSQNNFILDIVIELDLPKSLKLLYDLQPEIFTIPNNLKQNPLHIAALKNKPLSIKALYEINPDWIDEEDDSNKTPLIIAAEEGSLSAITVFYQLRPDAFLKLNKKKRSIISHMILIACSDIKSLHIYEMYSRPTSRKSIYLLYKKSASEKEEIQKKTDTEYLIEEMSRIVLEKYFPAIKFLMNLINDPRTLFLCDIDGETFLNYLIFMCQTPFKKNTFHLFKAFIKLIYDLNPKYLLSEIIENQEDSDSEKESVAPKKTPISFYPLFNILKNQLSEEAFLFLHHLYPNLMRYQDSLGNTIMHHLAVWSKKEPYKKEKYLSIFRYANTLDPKARYIKNKAQKRPLDFVDESIRSEFSSGLSKQKSSSKKSSFVALSILCGIGMVFSLLGYVHQKNLAE
ncbi:MAG: hypothetical protein WC688_02880 [Parachlamydiales bacterium]|jgi:ankyrin repeat protein